MFINLHNNLAIQLIATARVGLLNKNSLTQTQHSTVYESKFCKKNYHLHFLIAIRILTGDLCPDTAHTAM